MNICTQERRRKLVTVSRPRWSEGAADFAICIEERCAGRKSLLPVSALAGARAQCNSILLYCKGALVWKNWSPSSALVGARAQLNSIFVHRLGALV